MNLLPLLAAPVFAAQAVITGAPARLPAELPAVGRRAALRPGLAAGPRLQLSRPMILPAPAPNFDELPGKKPVAGVGLAGQDSPDKLEIELPKIFDGGRLAEAREEYSGFLVRLGFEDFSARIGSSLKARSLTESQKTVLEFNRSRYQVFNSARELAAGVMGGVAAQGYSKKSLARAADLAARLLTLQPLEPPATLPAEVARQKKKGIVAWLGKVTAQKLSAQSEQVASDVVGAMLPPELIERALSGKATQPERQVFEAAGKQAKAWADRILVTAYTDAEIGQTRYAGRALAAALVRYSRVEGKPEVEEKLSALAKERGLFLENFVGDKLVIRSKDGSAKAIPVENGDFLGERSGGREASEITFAVRPPLSLWNKARKEKLLGSPLGLWANPKSFPELVPGQRVRNALKLGVFKFKKWLAGRPSMQAGYSHVGMAQVQRADGVSMLWALDNYPNDGEGGIRKIGVAEQFAENGPYLRLGIGRLDAGRVWDDFRKQSTIGYQKTVYMSEGGNWPSLASESDFAALRAIPRKDAKVLLEKMNTAATAALEAMMTRLGVAFAYGFNNEIWRAYCSATMILAHRMGSQFEVQAKPDRWHPFVKVMKKLGMPGAKDQNMKGRIVWPGSLFIDPLIGKHQTVTFEKFTEVGRLADPFTMSAYVENDSALTRGLQALWRADPSAEIESEALTQSIRNHLDNRASKSRNKSGYSSGASDSTGYSAGLESLLSEADDD